MAYPHKWSPISYKSSAGQRKDTGQRPMLYRWTTQPWGRSCVHNKVFNLQCPRANVSVLFGSTCLLSCILLNAT